MKNVVILKIVITSAAVLLLIIDWIWRLAGC
jgi:hypothetical protein